MVGGGGSGRPRGGPASKRPCRRPVSPTGRRGPADALRTTPTLCDDHERGAAASLVSCSHQAVFYPMAKNDLLLATYFFIGFIAFSIPLLAHDAGIWSAGGGGAEYADSMPPAPPPPYYGSYHEPDDDATKFRHAVAEGDIATAAALLNASLAADAPVDFVTTPHWHGSTALFEAARSGHIEMAKWLVWICVYLDELRVCLLDMCVFR